MDNDIRKTYIVIYITYLVEYERKSDTESVTWGELHSL